MNPDFEEESAEQRSSVRHCLFSSTGLARHVACVTAVNPNCSFLCWIFAFCSRWWTSHPLISRYFDIILAAIFIYCRLYIMCLLFSSNGLPPGVTTPSSQLMCTSLIITNGWQYYTKWPKEVLCSSSTMCRRGPTVCSDKWIFHFFALLWSSVRANLWKWLQWWLLS